MKSSEALVIVFFVFCFSAHSITSDVGIADTAEAAKFFLADGVILTGSATGQEADHRQLESKAL